MHEVNARAGDDVTARGLHLKWERMRSMMKQVSIFIAKLILFQLLCDRPLNWNWTIREAGETDVRNEQNRTVNDEQGKINSARNSAYDYDREMFLGPHPGRPTKLDAFFVFACLRLVVCRAFSESFSVARSPCAQFYLRIVLPDQRSFGGRHGRFFPFRP